MPEVQNTSYLSIGEVLGLLLAEFPDITISKIRFLESQGLIAPERTPSGYRKFYEPDVELLKVILREQRENYLPLRVIKDRIDSGAIDPSGEMTKPDGLPEIQIGHAANDTLSTDDCRAERDGPERNRPRDAARHRRGNGRARAITAPTSTSPTPKPRFRRRRSPPIRLRTDRSRRHHHPGGVTVIRGHRCRLGARRERPRRAPRATRRPSCCPGCCSRAPSCAR